MTRWTDHIRSEAARLGVSYGCALSKPEVRETYYQKYPEVAKRKGIKVAAPKAPKAPKPSFTSRQLQSVDETPSRRGRRVESVELPIIEPSASPKTLKLGDMLVEEPKIDDIDLSDMLVEEPEKQKTIKIKPKFKKGKKGTGILDRFMGKDRLPKEAQAVLDKVGDKKIDFIFIQRVPVEAALKGMLDVLSLGQFSKATKKLGYDKVFHLSMIVQLEGGQDVVVEKNERINISFKIPPMKKGGEKILVGFRGRKTLNELLENTRKKIGDNAFFTYQSFKYNCQHFINAILDSNGINNPQAKAFILQDAGAILENMGDDFAYMRPLANSITDLGAAFNNLIYG